MVDSQYIIVESVEGTVNQEYNTSRKENAGKVYNDSWAGFEIHLSPTSHLFLKCDLGQGKLTNNN